MFSNAVFAPFNTFFLRILINMDTTGLMPDDIKPVNAPQSEAVRVKLTEYSHGSGCGCKIAPALLEDILKTSMPSTADPRLLVGNASKDDAAVYDLGNGTSVVSTTDFFMPIVDDPFEFGQIAATNAISDIYAMGGTPLVAISVFG